MAKRLKIALNYSYNEKWIGGTYYIENLISALNTLTNEKKPKIYIIGTQENFQKLKENINYPHLEYHHFYDDRPIIWRTLNKIWYAVFKSDFFKKNLKVETVFPFLNSVPFLTANKKIYWIPDFQEHFLPHFFLPQEINLRKENQNLISKSNDQLILSSKNALLNFQEIYPNHQVQTHVLPFAVNLPSISDVNFTTIKNEYNLPDEYYICANQFWIHKDHKTLIEAIYKLKQEGINKVVYLTGKTEDYRFPKYYQELTKLIKNYQLENQVISLGFLDRKVQLSIVKNAKAVIQPSLFEGWSTVIEDAKVLNQFIIASDIEIHKEQLDNYPNYVLFEKQNPKALAIILDELSHQLQIVHLEYNKNISEFGSLFLSIIKS